MSTKLVKASYALYVCLLLSFSAAAQLTANFSATPISGCAPLLVSFTDQSTGNPSSWRWTLGNGTTSFNRNPSVTYFTPGQYTVKLVVQNASGADSIIRTQYIQVYDKPTVDFSASSTAGCTPMFVQFTDLSTPGSGTNSSWFWDFGDGTTSTQQNPSHTYTATGNFNVSLIVTNSMGCSKSLTRPNFINITEKPNASFSIGSTANCGAPLTVSFTNTSTGAGTLSYAWNFGNGNTSTQINPSHTYQTTGTFTVTLVVTNQNGCRDTVVRPNAFTIANNITQFTAPASVCTNSSFSVTNSSSPAPINTTWDFGDGTSSDLFAPSKTYTAPGTYQIKLINNYGICSDSVVRNITVLAQPEPDFSGTPLSSCQAPLNVTFTNSSTGAVSYLWNFGDGATSTLANPTHTYMSQGNYAVTLTATGSNGCSKTLTRNQYINIQLPVVGINQLPQTGCAPFAWTFQHTVFGGDPIVSYLWNFGDGTTSTLQSPTHTFDSGTYTITLAITTTTGCTDTVRYINGIRVGERPDIRFSATPLSTCAETEIEFSDSTEPAATINQWLWEFGDGGTSTSQNPSHVYTDTGYFDVQLIAYNNGCPDTLVIPQYIHITPPIAIFTVKANCANRMRREFLDSSIGADTWLWNFGDGNTSTQQHPIHTYSAPGIYQVTLKVTNAASGCEYETRKVIYVVNGAPNFTADDTVVCKPAAVTFSITGVNPGLYNVYRWTFGDNTVGSGNPITKNYHISGRYTIRLASTDKNGCKDTVIKPQYITVNGPNARFGASVRNICSSARVDFTDSSTTDGRNNLVQWIWNYGDGQTDTLSTGNTSHVYQMGGAYTVSLTVVDNSGCSHQFSRANFITVYNPVAAFTTFDSLSCPGRTINFNNTSTGAGLTYLWTFGDGNSSTAQSPTHTYTTNGQFNIILAVTDQFGCRDTMVRNNMVTIVTPVAQFTVSDSIGTCPPLVVNFTNQSVNATSLVWDFGDATSSTLANPSHVYAVAGSFQSKLTITGPGGCTSVKTKRITVRGPSGSISYNPFTGCVPLNVNFRASVMNTTSLVWDYADGETFSTTDTVVSHAYIVDGAFIPRAILRDTAGCVVPISGTDTIRTYSLNAGFQFTAPVFCDRGDVTFQNTSTSTDVITAYQWTFGDGGTGNTGNPTHSYQQTGLYYPQMIVNTQHGCRDTVTSPNPVKIVASPQGQMNRSANGCVSLNVTFNGSLAAPDTSQLTWNWDFGNGNNSTQVNPPMQTYANAGNYPVRLVITNSSGCMDTVSTVVEAYAIPNVDAGRDTMVCKGTGSTLQATGASTYVWSPSTGLSCTTCATPLANPANPITYTVVGTSVHGCVNRDSIRVGVKYPFQMSSSGRDSLCKGGSLQLSASGAHSYQWSPATGLDNAQSATPTASPMSTTTYQVIGTDDRNCFRDTAYVPVIVFDIPTVEAGDDRTINVGQTLDLMPTISSDVIDARWSPTGSIFRDQFPGVTVRPNATTTYTVVVKNRGGCTASDQLTVNVICNGANLFIPNTFTPNNDGMNDKFYPRGTGLFTIKRMKIFSRWGEVVFERNNYSANDASKGWDGTFKGRALTPDVFVYVVEVLCDNNAVLTFKGNVALLK